MKWIISVGIFDYDFCPVNAEILEKINKSTFVGFKTDKNTIKKICQDKNIYAILSLS